MAVEYTANTVQTVEDNANIFFTNSPIPCNKGFVIHENNSGIITLRGVTNQCRARYRVSFGANVAIAEGGTVSPISVVITVNGEPINFSEMIVTPAAIGDYFNISRDIFIDVPKCCCYTIGVKNVSDTSIDVQNASIIIDRVA